MFYVYKMLPCVHMFVVILVNYLSSLNVLNSYRLCFIVVLNT
jgi:hypothetical protein